MPKPYYSNQSETGIFAFSQSKGDICGAITHPQMTKYGGRTIRETQALHQTKTQNVEIKTS